MDAKASMDINFCSNCKQKKKLNPAVLRAKFGNYCQACIQLSDRSKSAGSAQYDRDRDRESHLGDTVQPWINGKPNKDFAYLYPDKIDDYYSEQEKKEL